MRGPCTVPSVCRKFLLLKIVLVYVKQSAKPSKIHSTGGVLVDLFNKTGFTASKPHLVECSVTNRRYYTRGVLHCNCNNVIYLITCKNCLQQYVGSATNFKNRFRIHKSDIKTNKDRCGTAKHFNGMCKNDNNIFQFLSVQIIEQVCSNATNIEEILRHREKYWQSQLFTTSHGMSSLTDLHCSKRKGYRK